MPMFRFAFGILAALAVSIAALASEPTPAPIGPPRPSGAPIRPVRLYTPTTTTSTSSTTTTLPPVAVAADTPCQQWLPLMLEVGWPRDVEVLERALRIMYRESRCLPDACSKSDSGRVCRDWGLFQINEYSWRRTIEAQGLEMAAMWEPEENIRFALWLYQLSEERHGYGFGPWRMPPSTSSTTSAPGM